MVARVLPADSELVRMRDEGMTHKQIAEEISRRTGHTVARSTVSVALARAGEVKNHRVRYSETVPWTVPVRFSTEYQVRMLRLLGRHREGMKLNREERNRLKGWLHEVDEADVVVAFCPDPPAGEPGFHYIPSQFRDHDDPTLPIRKEPVDPSQLGY